MSIENRPFVGTWRLNNKKLIRSAPDALVYINGKPYLPGCPSCGGQVDIQKYVSAVTVDPSVEPVASASVTLQIPKAEEAALFRDGQFVMKTGMEINIYVKGYFPMKGLHHEVEPDQTGGIDLKNSVMYPYYHVFHGVVTEVSHEYAGGEHTASLSCADMLHFWGYQVMSTSGSAFGARPTNSGLRFTLVGHTFTGMTPYQIIYTLYRDVMGAAASVGFALGSSSNKDAESSTTGESIWSMTLLYWQRRFSQNFNELRMYGMNGALFNGYQQAFLGRLGTNDLNTLSKKFADPTNKSNELDPEADIKAQVARLVGYDPVAIYSGAASERNARDGGFGINVGEIQAFVADLSNHGNVNLFESEYQTKIDLATTVREMTGYEFYQDVDGDFVFKPPFYNMDTRASEAYVIKDVDLISISFSESEPEATYVKGTGSHFKNVSGFGLEGEWGTRTEFVDYRLVAQYGWREASFETYYITDPRAMFYSAVNRLDLENIAIHSASCQIPIRPELRPGYPVYLEPFDCFYYLHSFNHSFTFGSQCTTTLNLVGRRAKFYPPGLRPENGRQALVTDVKLDKPWLPQLPLRFEDNYGNFKYQGFPNVVLALDPEALNPNFFAVGLGTRDFSTTEGITALVREAEDLGILLIDDEGATVDTDKGEQRLKGPFRLKTGENTYTPIPTISSLVKMATNYQDALSQVNEANRKGRPVPTEARDALSSAEDGAEPLRRLIDAVRLRGKKGIPDADETINYLEALNDLKATFSPGKNIPGHYRYYSSAHPDVDQQGMKEVVANDEEQGTTQVAGLIELDNPINTDGLKVVDGKNKIDKIDIKAGIPIMRPNTGTRSGARAVPTPTHQIGTISFAQHLIRKRRTGEVRTGLKKRGFPSREMHISLLNLFVSGAAQTIPFDTVEDRFEPTYTSIRQTMVDAVLGIGLQQPIPSFPSFNAAILGAISDSGEPVDSLKSVEDQFPAAGPGPGLQQISEALASALARPASRAFRARFNELETQYGPVSSEDSSDAKIEAFDALDLAWAEMYSDIGWTAPETYTNHETKTATGYKTIEVYSPVFPVSDGGGYEVIGSYLYGRGLTVEDGGTFERLAGADFNNVSADAIDEFLNILINGDKDQKAVKPSEALGVLAERNPDAAAQLAVASKIETEEGQTILQAALANPDKFLNRFRNFSSDTKEASQKNPARNVAYNLTNLGRATRGQSCSCATSEADILFQTAGFDTLTESDDVFVQVAPGAVEEWVREQGSQKVRSWQAAQEAMRGNIRERETATLSDAFRRTKESLRSNYQRSVGQFTGALGDLADAQRQLDNDVADFGDGEG